MAGLTVDIPFVGPLDVGDLMATAPSGQGLSGSLSVGGAAVGSVIPGVGTAIGSVVGSLLGELTGMVKGRTQTFDWNTSNAYALKFSDQLARQTQASVPNVDAMALNFEMFVGAYIRNSGRWDAKRAGEVADGLISDKYGLKNKGTYDRIQAPLWELAMWILTQSDKNRPEELAKFFSAILPEAYVNYWFPSGAVSVSLPVSPTPGAGASSAPSPQLLSAPSAPATALRTYLLVGGAVILIIFTVVIALRK